MSNAVEKTEAVRLGTRTCRWCRQKYVWPIGAKSAGCPRCAPPLPGLERRA
ncbi:MAG: hypothetical protein KGK07_17195 [Chloroflexota bacterium]|nr:hypothetical protein [Chloroflexota bacterium]